MEEVILPFAGKYRIEGTNVTVFTAEGRFNKNFSTSIRAVGVVAVIKNKGKTAIMLKPEIEFPLFYVILVLIAGGGTTYALRVFKLE
ncbi:hypothetical protein [Thermococcus chitonophagus]|nr:hypothetical protein [Thermococcus chitonophagus]CUX76817.1 hypothetical protein CHITON_0038 [Thermococcus chitonophagus]